MCSGSVWFVIVTTGRKNLVKIEMVAIRGGIRCYLVIGNFKKDISKSTFEFSIT